MRHIKTSFTALACCLALAPLHPPAAAEATRVSQVDAQFAAWSAATPGCAIGVSKDGKTVLERAYGMADLEHDVAIRTDTIFEAGSISKQFTAAAVLLLARDGKLSLDDPIRKYIPEVPDYGTPVTIRQMLQHTSGLRDWGSVEDIAGWPRGTRVYTHAHVLDIVSRQSRLNFTPGTNWSYSNTGYNLAAILVSRVSGESFAEFTRKRIFEPLGMSRTSWRDDFTRVVKDRAIAYAESDGQYHMDMPFENIYGNGGLLTTVGDLMRWNGNFAMPKVGDAAFIELETTPGQFTNGVQHDYAFGLTIGDYRGIREIRHSGTTGSYRAYLSRFPAQQLSIAMLCNAGNSTPRATLHAVADLYLGAALEPEPAPKPVKLTDTALDAFTGHYRKTETGDTFAIGRDGSGLRVGDDAPLTALSPRRFTDGAGQTIEFDGKGGGTLDYGNGTSDVVQRVPVAAPTPIELAHLVGVYRSHDAEVTFEVVLQDATLEIKRRPADVFTLTPLYTDAFSSDLGTIIFRRDETGAPHAFSVVRDRVWDLRFERVDGESALAQLTAQADAWDKAIIRKDRAGIEANMDEDFRQIDGAGNVETRTSFVEGLVSDKLEIDPYTVEDFDVRLYGDVALLSGRTRMTGRYEGEPFKSHYRYIDIYVRKNSEWKIVSVQISKIP